MTHRVLILVASLLAASAVCAENCAEELGNWPFGPPKAAAIANNSLAFNDGRVLRIADITTVQSPSVSGSLVLDTVPSSVFLHQDYVYVLDGTSSLTSSLTVVSVASPDAPVKIATVDIGVPVSIAQMSSDKIFVLGLPRGYAYPQLKVIDLANPASPQVAGSLELTQEGMEYSLYGYYLAVSDTTAVVLSHWWEGAMIVDASNVSAPLVASTVQWDFYPLGAAASQNYVYVRGASNIWVLDVSDPSSPEWGATLDTNSSAVNLFVGGADQLFEISGAYGHKNLTVYDVTAPAQPSEAATINLDKDINSLSLVADGRFAAVGTTSGEWILIDASIMGNPVNASTLATSTGIESAAVSGTFVFATHRSVPEVKIIDFSDPNNPVQVESITVNAKDIKIRDERAYLAAGSDGLVIFDITDPTQAFELARLQLGNGYGTLFYAQSIAVAGQFAFLFDQSNFLNVIDVSQASQPVVVWSDELPNGPDSMDRMVASNGFLFGLGGSAGSDICAIDVRTPTQPVVADCIYGGSSTQDLAVDGNLLFVASRYIDGEFRTYDVSDPGNLQLLRKVPVSGLPSGVAVRDSQAFVAESGFGIRVFDVEDASLPLAKLLTPASGFAVGAILAGDILVVPTTDVGISFFDIAQCDPLANSLFIAAAASGGGIGDSRWTTDVEISNPLSRGSSAQFRFLHRELDNRQEPFTNSHVYDPGQSVRFRDLWGTKMGDGAGAIQIRASHPDTILVNSRTLNTGDEGTYGQGIPAIGVDDLISYGNTARLILLTQNNRFRTNIGFLNPTGQTIDLVVDFYNEEGSHLGSDGLALMAKSSAQWNRAFRRLTADAITDGWVDVSTTSEGARFFAYGSVVDASTGDPTTIMPQPAGALLIPAAASAEGIGGSFWTTDVEINNVSNQSVTYQFKLLPRGADNSDATASLEYQLAPNSGARYSDIWGEFSAEEGAGAVEVVCAEPENLLVMSRTFNTGDAGTFGQGIAAISDDHTFGIGDRPRLIQLSQSGNFRSNIGFVNTTDQEIRLEVQFYNNNAAVLGTSSINLAPFSNAQWSEAFTRVTSDGVFGYVEVWTTAEDARFFTYGSVVDKRTGDPTTILPR